MPELLARSSSIWFDRIEAEHDNFRAVLGDALEHGPTDVALRICSAIRHFWWTRGSWSEGRRWLDLALAAGTESDRQLRFDLLWGAGLLALRQGDVGRGSAVAEEMLGLGAGDEQYVGVAGGGDDAESVALEVVVGACGEGEFVFAAVAGAGVDVADGEAARVVGGGEVEAAEVSEGVSIGRRRRSRARSSC